jgi:hypothetical protein
MKQKKNLKHPLILQAIVVIVGNLIKKNNVFQCFFVPPSPKKQGEFFGYILDPCCRQSGNVFVDFSQVLAIENLKKDT